MFWRKISNPAILVPDCCHAFIHGKNMRGGEQACYVIAALVEPADVPPAPLC
jgi:hypothetical protein